MANNLSNNNAPTAFIKPKFSFYTTIHKAIRKIIFETCILAGMTDFSDKKSAALLMEKFSSLLILLRHHSINEDSFIHPLLAKKQLAEFDYMQHDHEALEEQLNQLEKLLATVFAAKDKTKIFALGNTFYLALNQFNSVYLHHLHLEETKIMTCLLENYELSMLQEAMERFLKSQAPAEAMRTLTLMLAAINPQEALFLLNNIQQAAPPKIFLHLCELAQNLMSEDNWQKIASQLCIDR
jgi:hypothetical protein